MPMGQNDLRVHSFGIKVSWIIVTILKRTKVARTKSPYPASEWAEWFDKQMTKIAKKKNAEVVGLQKMYRKFKNYPTSKCSHNTDLEAKSGSVLSFRFPANLR